MINERNGADFEAKRAKKKEEGQHIMSHPRSNKLGSKDLIPGVIRTSRVQLKSSTLGLSHSGCQAGCHLGYSPKTLPI